MNASGQTEISQSGLVRGKSKQPPQTKQAKKIAEEIRAFDVSPESSAVKTGPIVDFHPSQQVAGDLLTTSLQLNQLTSENQVSQ